MKFGTIRHLDKPVSRLIMGVIPLIGKTDEEAFAILDAYRAAGGNCIDNSYSYGERPGTLMGSYFAARGEDALIRLDKGNHHTSNDDAGRRVTQEDIEHDLLGNFERQGTSYSDLYLLHRDDERVPAGHVLEWLNEYVKRGQVRAIGGSNWKHTRLAEANKYAEEHGLQGFTVSSPNLSLAMANEEMWWEALSISKDREAREWYAANDVAVLSWSAGGGGFFAEVDTPDVRRVYDNPSNFARKERLIQMAGEKKFSPTQLALAWTLHQPGNIFALIGPGDLNQLNDNLAASEITLSDQERDWLESGD